jgi:molecular chaperone GrpE
MKKEEVKVKVNAEEPKNKKEEPAKQEAEKAKKPTAEELQQQVIFLTKQAAEAQKKAREAEDKAKSEEIKLQTALSQYVRLQADFDNFRRRTKDSEAKAADTYKAETLKSFLPVLDNFELALSHMKKEENGEAYVKGFELLQKQMVKIMTDFGVKEIESKGKTFDPHFHEAVMMVPSDEMEDETIAMVFQKGYLYKDTVLRPAKVQVVKNN